MLLWEKPQEGLREHALVRAHQKDDGLKLGEQFARGVVYLLQHHRLRGEVRREPQEDLGGASIRITSLEKGLKSLSKHLVIFHTIGAGVLHKDGVSFHPVQRQLVSSRLVAIIPFGAVHDAEGSPQRREGGLP